MHALRKHFCATLSMQIVLVCAICLVLSTEAYAGGEPEHRLLTYTLALGAGFSVEDSRTLADASWGQDTNKAMTAFSGISDVGSAIVETLALTSDAPRIRRLMDSDGAFDREFTQPDGALRRIASSVFVHSLVRDPGRLRRADLPQETENEFRPEDARIRVNLDASYHRFLREQQSTLRASGVEAPRVHAAGLLIAGQYIHQFLDAYSHPEDSLKGHILSGTLPDQAWSDPPRYKTAALWTLKELKLLRRNLETTDERGALFQLSNDTDQKQFADKMVDAIIVGYKIGIGETTVLRPIRAWPSELTDKKRHQFTEALEKALNGSTLRRHPTFHITVPGVTKVDYQHSKDGRMRVHYDRFGADVTMDDFVRWTKNQPQSEVLWKSLRTNVRGFIHKYPERANLMLKQLGSWKRELGEKRQNVLDRIKIYRKESDELDRVRRMGSMPLPTVDLDMERVARRRAEEEEARKPRGGTRHQGTEQQAPTRVPSSPSAPRNPCPNPGFNSDGTPHC